MTSSWFFLSTLNYDARSTTHQINIIIFTYISSNSRLLKWNYKPYFFPCTLALNLLSYLFQHLVINFWYSLVNIRTIWCDNKKINILPDRIYKFSSILDLNSLSYLFQHLVISFWYSLVSIRTICCDNKKINFCQTEYINFVPFIWHWDENNCNHFKVCTEYMDMI